MRKKTEINKIRYEKRERLIYSPMKYRKTLGNTMKTYIKKGWKA